MTLTLPKKSLLSLISVLVMSVLIWSIGYLTPRSEFLLFISQYLILFALFYYVWLNKQGWSFRTFFYVAIGLRLMLFFAAPELSNDFFRFIWDGELLTKGINPFAHKPNELISQVGFFDEQYMRVLYHGMGSLSQEHYTCYPVLNQLFFLPAAAFTDTLSYNVMLLKAVVILGDIGAIYFAKKIAEHLGQRVHVIWLYALNPFVILEFSGNVHFEGIMIFFLLGSIYYILKNKWIQGSLLMGLAIQIKLIPLLLLLFVYKKLKVFNAIGFTALTLVVVLLVGGLMLNSTFLGNMMESINAYFVRFQFNSSFYNAIVNGLYFYPDNSAGLLPPDPFPDRFAVVGKLLSSISTIGIVLLAIFKAYRNELDPLKGMLFALVIYYTFATTVHPWYISLILVFSVFTKYQFGVVWSIVVMLSYSAYATDGFENYTSLFSIAEYSIVYGVLIYECVKYWKKDAVGVQFNLFFSK